MADRTTSANTLKTYVSTEYAAPEQWRGERATQATDVYALGCIGHTLLSGRPPFGGPDFREQHLSDDPPNLEGHDPALRSLMADMLRKVAPSRPSVDRIISRLTTLAAGSRATSPGLEALAGAGARDAERVSSEEAKAEAERNAAERRHALAKTAMQVLEKVVTQLFDEIREQASTARENGSLPYQAEKGRILGHIRLGEGVLTVRRNMIHGIIAPEEFPFSKWDVIVGATIEIEQLTPHYVWAASLWYTNLHSRSEYRWYDVAYCTHVLSSSPRSFEPFDLTDHSEADKAATIGNHRIGLAYDPKPIDDEAVNGFISRWAGLLAQASTGELRRPNLPLEHRLPIAMRSW